MISKIKWDGHPILKNLELNFQKEDGDIYNTIVLVGENGVGKTTILDTLARFLNGGSFEPFEYIQYIIDDTYTITKDTSLNASLGFHIRKCTKDGSIKKIRTNFNNDFKELEEDEADLRHYGVTYSKARSGFQTKAVKSITTKQLDEGKYETDEDEDFTSIKQLLIDIYSEDTNEWYKLSEDHSAVMFSEFQRGSRTYRFKQAFDNFFDSMNYRGIEDDDPKEKKVVFEKHGSIISVDRLSTGEKQVVFRGAQLLKNKNNIFGGTVLIDEPELSMHPKWQQKILQYYRGLFTKDGEQNVQMIFATHSEYVLNAALDDKDNVLVIDLKDENGSIIPHRITERSVLPYTSFAETNYLVFDIVSEEYHISLYGYLQNKIDEQSVKKCDDYISESPPYDPKTDAKDSSYNNTTYKTLPTYIRNAIDHPDSNHSYTEHELRQSIILLRKLCQ